MSLTPGKLMTTKNAKIGNEVILVNVSRHGYFVSPSNPLVKTKFECTGIIDEINHDSISVAWSNGYHNSYHDNTLALASDEACVSIWD